MKSSELRRLSVGDRVQVLDPDSTAVVGTVAEVGYAALRVIWQDGVASVFHFSQDEHKQGVLPRLERMPPPKQFPRDPAEARKLGRCFICNQTLDRPPGRPRRTLCDLHTGLGFDRERGMRWREYFEKRAGNPGVELPHPDAHA